MPSLQINQNHFTLKVDLVNLAQLVLTLQNKANTTSQQNLHHLIFTTQSYTNHPISYIFQTLETLYHQIEKANKNKSILIQNEKMTLIIQVNGKKLFKQIRIQQKYTNQQTNHMNINVCYKNNQMLNKDHKNQIIVLGQSKNTIQQRPQRQYQLQLKKIKVQNFYLKKEIKNLKEHIKQIQNVSQLQQQSQDEHQTRQDSFQQIIEENKELTNIQNSRKKLIVLKKLNQKQYRQKIILI